MFQDKLPLALREKPRKSLKLTNRKRNVKKMKGKLSKKPGEPCHKLVGLFQTNQSPRSALFRSRWKPARS